MDVRDYPELAMRTSPKEHDRLLNGGLGLIGESGEVVDVIKKWLFQSGNNAPFPREKLIDEMGDVLWYCVEYSSGAGVDAASAFEWAAGLNKFADGDRERLVSSAVSLVNQCVRAQAAENYDSRASAIALIISQVRYMLDVFCKCTLEEAMEKNVAKLRRRYPEGFDPERSLHREGEKP